MFICKYLVPMYVMHRYVNVYTDICICSLAYPYEYCRGGKITFLLHSQVLLVGLIIKLTWDKLRWENNQIYYACSYGGSGRTWDQRTDQAVEAYVSSLAKKKVVGGGFGTTKGRTGIHMDMKSKCAFPLHFLKLSFQWLPHWLHMLEH